nr:MAG TPA: hypothetical protein [Caudoviricetes sp.]
MVVARKILLQQPCNLPHPLKNRIKTGKVLLGALLIVSCTSYVGLWITI